MILIKTEYVTLLTVTVSLLSGWGGAFIAGYFSRRANIEVMEKEHQISLEKMKETERINLLQLYVSIIKLDFEKNPITYYPNGAMSLDDNFFKDEIRPLVYDKYHLIHEKVIVYFNNIEKCNAEINNTGNYDEMDMVDIANTYLNMVTEIKEIVDTQRAKM